jgi:hypothetical protein
MANYPEYEYAGSDTELYKTNLYTGSDSDLDNTAPVDDTDGYTSNIDLTQNVGAIVDFKFTGSGSTDDLVLKLFRRRDSSWDGDEIAIDTITVSNDGSEDIFSYHLKGPGHYRFSMQSEGATDTFDIDVEMRTYRYEIATS